VLEEAGLSIYDITEDRVTLSGNTLPCRSGRCWSAAQAWLRRPRGQRGALLERRTGALLASDAGRPLRLRRPELPARVDLRHVGSFTPTVEGLTLEPTTWSATSAADKQGAMTLAAFRVEFPEHRDIVPARKSKARWISNSMRAWISRSARAGAVPAISNTSISTPTST